MKGARSQLLQAATCAAVATCVCDKSPPGREGTTQRNDFSRETLPTRTRCAPKGNKVAKPNEKLVARNVRQNDSMPVACTILSVRKLTPGQQSPPTNKPHSLNNSGQFPDLWTRTFADLPCFQGPSVPRNVQKSPIFVRPMGPLTTHPKIMVHLPKSPMISQLQRRILYVRRRSRSKSHATIVAHANSAFARTNCSTANWRSSRLSAAETCTRIRALPMGTTG